MMAKLACGVALAVGLGGCVQATRHSNAIVFGTNTSLGVNIGPSASSVPSINVGYNRQEAVFLPLVANVGEVSQSRTSQNRRNGTASGTTTTTTTSSLLTPCDVGAAVQVVAQAGGGTAAPFPIHPCLLVATNRQASDSYSVLASFGAKMGAAAGATDANVQVGLAQYFSTGMAAQLLANNGGASVVSVSAPPPGPQAAATAAALFGTDQQRLRALQVVNDYAAFREGLVARIGSNADPVMLTNLQGFERKIGARLLLSIDCTDKAACLTYLSDPANDPFDSNFAIDPARLQGALATWGQP